MNIDDLKKVALQNELRIDSHENFNRTPPFYFDSLRHGFESFFKTFQTNSTYFLSYVDSFQTVNSLLYNDDENIVKTIIFFERFFELYYKDILRKVHINLTLQQKKKDSDIKNIVLDIEKNSFKPKRYKSENLSCNFIAILNRFYGLIKLSEEQKDSYSPLVKEFNKLLSKYNFLDNEKHKNSMHLLSWFRDRLLHNGSRVPTLWLYDYFFTQKIVPIVYKIREVEEENIEDSFFYFKTITGIDILQLLNETKFELKPEYNTAEIDDIKFKLLKLGHLKEFGRVSLNMHLHVRNHNRPAYEYNYDDFKGRGMRFANAEKEHKHFEKIINCICCNEKSLVKYSFKTNTLSGEPQIIAWVKCYTCEYYVQYDDYDPYLFKLSQSPIFQ